MSATISEPKGAGRAIATHEPVLVPPRRGGQSMLADLMAGLRAHRLWMFMGRREVTRPYARTRIGVFWIPLNVLLHVVILGTVFAPVFDGGARYFVYFALSFSIWKPFAQVLGIASALWPDSENYVKHLPAPISLYVIKGVYKALLLMGLNLPMGIAIALVVGARPGWSALLAVPGLLVFVLNIAWITVALSVVALRFRDVQQFMPNLLFIIYLITPILWEPERLGQNRWMAEINPLYHMIVLVRDPLLGVVPSTLSWAAAIGLAVIGNLVAWSVLGSVRRRIPLWL